MSRLLILALFVLSVPSLSAAPVPPLKVPKELLQERLKAAINTYRFKQRQIHVGVGKLTELFEWSRRWLDAQLVLCETKKDRLDAYQAYVERTRQLEQAIHSFVKAARSAPADGSAATYYRTEAEIMLLEAGGQLPKEAEAKPPADQEELPNLRPQKNAVEEEGDQPRPKRVKIRVEEEEPAPKKKPPAKKPS